MAWFIKTVEVSGARRSHGKGSITPLVIPYVLTFGLIATAICVVAWWEERLYQVKVGLEIALFELAGAALGLLLALRTIAGCGRLGNACELWGRIVNHTRDTVVSGLAYGPTDPHRRKRFLKWAMRFSHCMR